MLLIGIEFQVFEAYFLQCRFHHLDFTWRAKPCALTALKVGVAPKLSHQSITECIILSWQHLFLHVLEPTTINLRLIAAIELAII